MSQSIALDIGGTQRSAAGFSPGDEAPNLSNWITTHNPEYTPLQRRISERNNLRVTKGNREYVPAFTQADQISDGSAAHF